MFSRTAWSRVSVAAPRPVNLLPRASQPFSPSPSPSPSTSYAIHTTSPACAVRPSVLKKERQRQKRKAMLERQELKERVQELTKPDPVLGHQLNEKGEALWRQSDLCKVMLTKDDVWGVAEDRRGNLVNVEQDDVSSVYDDNDSRPEAQLGPKRLNFGLDNEQDRKMLFSELPAVMYEDETRDKLSTSSLSAEDLEHISQDVQHAEENVHNNAAMISRILDLRNASGKGVQVENVRRIVNHFGARLGEEGGAVDTGSPEVQAAVMTYRIRNLHEHLQNARHDNANRRGIAMLVHKRAKVLKYLKKKSPVRYEAILPRLGLEARAVEGEIIVPGKPLMKVTS